MACIVSSRRADNPRKVCPVNVMGAFSWACEILRISVPAPPSFCPKSSGSGSIFNELFACLEQSPANSSNSRSRERRRFVSSVGRKDTFFILARIVCWKTQFWNINSHFGRNLFLFFRQGWFFWGFLVSFVGPINAQNLCGFYIQVFVFILVVLVSSTPVIFRLMCIWHHLTVNFL